ncbi:MAG TPA: type II secretion system F family protein [Rhodocyclaceae bacterium]|nr:type II secretion system F family protein [Rhodocyclaceae bacterium]
MRYELKAIRGKEGLAALIVDAGDRNDAIDQVQAQGYQVITVQARDTWAGMSGRFYRFPLVQFSQELLALLEAGLPLLEAIETLAEREQRPGLRKMLAQIKAKLYEGQPLSHALQQFPDQFPSLYIATVRASERTGALPEALARYIVYQSQMDAVRRQVVSSSIYPVLLVCVGGLVALFLMLYVVPRFSRIYADMGGHPPLLSRLLMQWGQLMGEHSLLVAGGVLGAAALLTYLGSRPAFRHWLEQLLWRLPKIGERLYIYQLARFYRSLGMLLRGGMPVVTALQMSADLLQYSLRGQLAKALASIREGQPISLAMETHLLTTPVALRMLRVGERTGQMGDMMERIAAFYEEETARWVERFTKLFEPLLMVFIGGLIGLIVLLMYFPIFELAGAIQ